MPLSDSQRAIGAVTTVIRDHLINRAGEQVFVGKPEDAAGGTGAARINLFLYELEFDASLKNLSLEAGRNPPLWLVLKYAITCFDTTGQSDTADSHELLGAVLRALQEIAYVPLDGLLPAGVQQALEKNPEPLKLTFDYGSSDLLSKLMQGTDEKYRLSVVFQVRPVMITPSSPPRYSLLVGIDYTQPGQPEIEIEDALGLEVLPSLGPVLESVAPRRVEGAHSVTVQGTDLGDAALTLAGEALTVTEQGANQIVATFPASITGGTTLSAGSLPLRAEQPLAGGRIRPSNLLELRLLPTLTSASKSGVNINGGIATGSVVLDGMLLGTEDDDSILAFYRNGQVVRGFDDLSTNASQTQRTLTLVAGDALPAESYRVILSVNGQQALSSPTLDLSVP